MMISATQKKREKLKELIWYICKNFGVELYETKLWKLAFFCDADYYQKYQSLITDVPYIKNNHGPTPVFNIAQKATGDLLKNNYIIKADSGAYVAIKDYHVKYLEQPQIDAINATCAKYSKLSVNDICTLAHQDPVYLAGEKNQVLDFSFVAYRDDGSPHDEDQYTGTQEIKFSKKATENLMHLLEV